MCGVSPGALAWTASEAVLGVANQIQIATGPTDDVVLEYYGRYTRWDATGALVVEDLFDAPSPSGYEFNWSNPVIDAQANVTQCVGYEDTSAVAVVTCARHTRCAGKVFDLGNNWVWSSQGWELFGDEQVTSEIAVDATGNTYGHARFMGSYSDFVQFEISPTGTSTASEGGGLPQTTGPDGSTYALLPTGKSFTTGCGTLTSPTGNGLALVVSTAGGTCVWAKMLSPSSPVSAPTPVGVGADGSVAVAVAYKGTIDFGAGPITSGGGSSLGLARFDALGNLVWSKALGAAGTNMNSGSAQLAASGIMLVIGGYAGSPDLGAGPLPSTDDTFVAAFDAAGALRWNKAVLVGSGKALVAAPGSCGAFVATNSPTVDFGTGPVATSTTLGLAAFGL